jgi:WD40 repeat protein
MFIGYSLFKSGDNAGKPDWIINTPSSVTCICFHPKKRNIVAIGLGNGSLEVHDIDKQEQNSTRICSSGINEIFHTDEVTSLQWCIYGVNKAIKMILMSGSRDGKMLLWDMATRLKFPKRGYLLSVDKTKEANKNILISGKI